MKRRRNEFLVTWRNTDDEIFIKSFTTRPEATEYALTEIDTRRDVADWDIFVPIGELDQAEDEYEQLEKKIAKAKEALGVQ